MHGELRNSKQSNRSKCREYGEGVSKVGKVDGAGSANV